MSTLPIADYAFLSDCNSAALVSTDGSVDWLAFPRFDAPSVLGRLLDPRAGHLRLGTTGPARVTRRYLDGGLVLETTRRTDGGVLRITDAMALGEGERGHDIGLSAPHALVRHATCESGRVEVELSYAPRPEYGLAVPLLRRTPHGIEVRGEADTLFLTTDLPMTVEGGVATGRTTLRAGQSVGVVLQWAAPGEVAPPWDAGEIARRIADTAEGWASWSANHQSYQGPWRDLVRLSGAVLQGLTFTRTGAIVAAPTTSLPEVVGGTRNWDYRYSWLRDASMTLDALWVAACPDEAGQFVSWLVDAAAADLGGGRRIQIVYGLAGEHDLTERTLDHLAGWRDSRPVRIGNGAFAQRQLDVYGEVLNAVHRLRPQIFPTDPATATFLRGLADAAAQQWRDPDRGIWEVRGDPQRFVHSAVMCWVALDRALRMAGELGAGADARARWLLERDSIMAEVLERGFNPARGAFTQSLDADTLDASALLIPIVGFLPGRDPRVLSTIAAIEESLVDEHGLVYRYRSDDGLEGSEGAFVICTFWLAHAHAAAGHVDRAREVFARAIGLRNDLGLLAEERLGDQMLGNFPQAFSHIGLVNAAWAISQAER
ncbi:glycoside hydrolase family 15 protein [Promicromonospora sp. NPDC057138]|uniref:glycoside hydrolase family 15 protein n=1 Tax=Promicromonospora sp. NPDC057138 TaxID=3346031 RepID=UPI00364303D5